MPTDYDLTIDGKTFGLTWGKATPPTQADIEGIVAQYRAQSKPAATSTPPGPTQNYSGNLTQGASTPSSFRSDLAVDPLTPAAQSLSDAGAGAAAGTAGSTPLPASATGPQSSTYEAPSNPGAMGAFPTSRNPTTGQRVSPLGDNPDPLQQFRNDYFNTLNKNANIPMQAAVALSKNPDDANWTARLAQMSPVAQTAIKQKASELANAPVYEAPSNPGAMGAAPTFRDANTGARTAIPLPHDIIGTMLHGPEGYKQLQQAQGAIPEITRMAESSLDPENLAFIGAAGAIGAMGKVGQAVVKAGIGLTMGANAVSKLRQGDLGGAAVDALLGAIPIAEHPISEAIGKAVDKAKMIGTANALDATETTPTGQFAPGTPYQIPDIFRAPVADPAGARAVIDPTTNTIAPAPGAALAPHEQAAIDTHNTNVRGMEIYKQNLIDAVKEATDAGKADVAAIYQKQLDALNKTTPQGEANGQTTVAPGTEALGPTVAPAELLRIQPKGQNPEAVPAGATASGDLPAATTGEPLSAGQPTVPASPDTASGSVGAVQTDGIRAANEETEARRAEKGLPELPGYTAKTSEQVYQEVRDQGQSANALSVADDVIANKRAMTAHEIAANVIKQNEIEAQQDGLYKQIMESAKAGKPFDTLQAEYDGLDHQYQKLTDATKYSGSEQSLAFRIRDYEVNRYSRQQVLKRLALSQPDVPLTTADKDLVAQKTQEHGTLQEGLDKAQSAVDAQHANADEIASQGAANTAIDGMKTKAQKVQKEVWVLRDEQRAKLDAEYQQLQDQLVRKTSQANALVDPSLLPVIKDIAKNRVQYGFTKLADLVDEVHKAVEPHVPGITKREVRDAISGYGYGSKIPVGTQLGDMKKQARLLSQIEDIRDKVPQQARNKVPVSDEVKALRQQKAEAQAENRPPRKQTSAERQLEGYKTQLRGTIDDLTRRIADKDFSAQGRSKLLLDPEAIQLKSQRDALQKVYDSFDPNKTPEARSQKARERESATRLERLEKQFNDMKSSNAAGDYGKPNEPARPDTPEEAAMRAKLDAARAERDSMRAAKNEAAPSDPLKGYKNQLANQIADMQKQIDSGLTDRASGGKTKQLDAEAQVLRDQRDQMREAVNRKRAEIDRIIEARKGKSFLDKYAIYHRAAILSRVSTLAKLGSAAFQRAAFTPIEEGAGAAMHAIPGYGKIAEKAPHGTPSIAAEGAALRSLADVKGNVADAKLKLITGMNSLDAKYGQKGFEQDAEPINLFTAPQNIHGAIKTPIQRAAFERSMVQQERFELRQGHDINDPAVRTVMEARAYMKSKEAILMQDNMLSTAWQGMVKGLETNPKLGKSGKVLASAARAALPIVKVPSNFVGEAISHTPGAGLIRPAYELAISKGIEGLSPEQADIIVTALKKHAVGSALFALGYYQADKMGGFYHPGGNGMNDVKPNEVRVNLFGKALDVPSTFLHSPQMEVMMMGAAFRQAIEQAQNSRSRNPSSPTEEALHRTAFGVADALPFVDTPKRLLEATEGSAAAGKAIGNTLGSATIPGFLPDIASQLDRDPQNHMQVRQRPSKGFGDALKLSTGVLRGTVDQSSGRRR